MVRASLARRSPVDMEASHIARQAVPVRCQTHEFHLRIQAQGRPGAAPRIASSWYLRSGQRE